MKKLVFLFSFLVTLCGCKGDIYKINIYTRDASSGTREAFFKGIDVEDISNDSIEVSSNGDMIVKVKNDYNSIGYVSLNEELFNTGVSILSFEGVFPTYESVLDKTYTLQRAFSYVTRAKDDFENEREEQLVDAFIDFITKSKEGMLVIQSAGGIVDASKGQPWEELKLNHPIVLQDNSDLTIITAGSTSVEKTITLALEVFKAMAGDFNFMVNQTGSSDGYKRVLGSEKDGINASDIGFSSRAFKKEEEVSKGKYTGEYCLDAVVVITNKENALTNISKEDLFKIYSGEITSFKEIGN